jgi:hypothetical protein
MNEFLTHPWPIAVVILTALLLRRKLKFWGPGFGMEVNHEPGDDGPEPGSNAARLPKPPKPAPRRSPGKQKKPKRRKK